ncbi:MAG TPA: type II secretion system protein [Acidisoma sp.]|nr:type II secretion system protein [Acidisoma sp.]
MQVASTVASIALWHAGRLKYVPWLAALGLVFGVLAWICDPYFYTHGASAWQTPLSIWPLLQPGASTIYLIVWLMYANRVLLLRSLHELGQALADGWPPFVASARDGRIRKDATRKGSPSVRNRTGFTLLELLIVIGIVVLLAAILLPVFASAREEAHRIACLSNERQMGMAMALYVGDNDDVFPSASGSPGTGWASACIPYVKNAKVFACPDDPTKPVTVVSFGRHAGYLLSPVSYGFNSNLSGLVSFPDDDINSHPPIGLGAVNAPASTVLFFEVMNATANMSPGAAGAGSASGDGGADCGSPPTYPCGDSIIANHQEIPCIRYTTGNIGGRQLNGDGKSGNFCGLLEHLPIGSAPRHGAGSDYVAADGHAVWLRPEQVSGGRSAVAEDCAQGTSTTQPRDCRDQAANQAAGTQFGGYILTFSAK